MFRVTQLGLNPALLSFNKLKESQIGGLLSKIWPQLLELIALLHLPSRDATYLTFSSCHLWSVSIAAVLYYESLPHPHSQSDSLSFPLGLSMAAVPSIFNHWATLSLLCLFIVVLCLEAWPFLVYFTLRLSPRFLTQAFTAIAALLATLVLLSNYDS